MSINIFNYIDKTKQNLCVSVQIKYPKSKPYHNHTIVYIYLHIS